MHPEVFSCAEGKRRQMRTFTYTDDRSNIFWRIALQGKSFTVTFGKVGTAGQAQTKEFKDDAAARKALDKLEEEKLGKDYVETTSSAPARGSDAVRDTLEAAIRDDPEDLAAHLALADHLQVQGDPRGEFIAVQLALEDPKRSAAQRKKLQRQEGELFRAHGQEWLGPTLNAALGWTAALSPNERRTTFRRGWLWALTLEGNDDEYALVFQALTAAPEARFVYDLRIDREQDSVPLKVLARAAFAPFLRRLTVGEGESYTHTGGAGAPALVSDLPRLEALTLYAHLGQDDAARLFAAPMPALRELEVCCTWHYPLDVLAKNRTLTRLRRVYFFPHMQEHGDAAYLNAARLRALGASKHLTELADLTFKMWDGGDAAADALVETGVLFRLERLDLSMGNLTDAGAQTMARALASRPHRLRSLDLSNNAVTPAGLKALRTAGVKVDCTFSHPPDSDDSLAYEGDVE
jgi:uncharacterized protein (TIGR02996 family)